MNRQIAFATIVLAIAPFGCAKALREPVPLPAPDTVAAPDETVDPAALFATREIEAVRAAADAWRARLAHDDRTFETVQGLTRAEMWLAGHEPDAADRKDASRRAVEAGQWCEAVAGDRPECGYWLAAALGVQARERRSTGLDALPRIESMFLAARSSIPEYDHAGADRALALIYLRAPGFPTGIGDPETGLEHAREAVGRFPDWPPNQLALGEALAAMDEVGDGAAAYRLALELAQNAHADDPDTPEWREEAEEALAALQKEE